MLNSSAMTWLLVAESVVKVLAALLTPIIAVIAVLIARQQSITNKRQLRLALFDRRMSIFDSATKLMKAAINQKNLGTEEIFTFAWETRQCEFLFGQDIVAYLKEVLTKAAKMHEELFTGQNPARVTELVTWFIAQMDEAKKKFGKYMEFPEAF